MKKIIFISILIIILTAGYSYAIINCHGDSGEPESEMTGGQGVIDNRQESAVGDGKTNSHQTPKSDAAEHTQQDNNTLKNTMPNASKEGILK
ncbi:MAG: hypothetical protein HY957_00130 [Nitrospirae bacterium]|nr:hypothetical protein [Nitrospirota bacterium]